MKLGIFCGQEQLANHAFMARDSQARRIGLIGRRSFQPGEALCIPCCNRVHTFGVLFPIDLVFISKDQIVMAVWPEVGPGNEVWQPDAHSVIELPAGAAANVEAGDRLLFQPIS